MKHRGLFRRLDKISGPIKPPRDYEVDASVMWILLHLTRSEESQLVGVTLRLNQLKPGGATQKELDEVHAEQTSILAAGEERASKDQRREEYKTRWTRQQTLRAIGRPPTVAESAEDQQLAKWLNDVKAKLEKDLDA
jgi:hypothetical protein